MPYQPNEPVTVADLSGRTVILVGSTVGIGLEAAKHFARMGPKRLICTGRNEEKCAYVVEAVRKETGYAAVEGWPLELNDFASVKAFVDRFEKEGGDLDLLVENAAVARFDYRMGNSGYEELIQVNHLSTALLALLLLPYLLKTAQKNGTISRVVCVTSGAHNASDVPKYNFAKDVKIFETMSTPEFNNSEKVLKQRYPDSKFFNVAFVRALQDHISPSTPLIINNVDPGFCITSLRRNVDPSIFVELDKTARTSEEGSRQLIWASVGPDPKQLDSAEVTNVMRGAWAGPCLALTDPHPVFKTEAGAALQQRLWDETWEILTSVDPRVSQVSEIFQK